MILLINITPIILIKNKFKKIQQQQQHQIPNHVQDQKLRGIGPGEISQVFSISILFLKRIELKQEQKNNQDKKEYF